MIKEQTDSTDTTEQSEKNKVPPGPGLLPNQMNSSSNMPPGGMVPGGMGGAMVPPGMMPMNNSGMPVCMLFLLGIVLR